MPSVVVELTPLSGIWQRMHDCRPGLPLFWIRLAMSHYVGVLFPCVDLLG